MISEFQFPRIVTLGLTISLLGTMSTSAAETVSGSLHSKIDALIAANASGEPVANLSDDAEFLRRVSLDLAGTIPTADKVRAFLADTSPVKRQQAIDELLASPQWSGRMADLFHVILMERRGDDADWRAWLEQSFAGNKPWNQLVYQVLNADAEDESNRAAAYFMAKRLDKYGQNPVDYPGLVRDIGRMFLGQDLQCAECHDHLFIDDYKQLDFQGLFAVYQNTFVRKDVKFSAVGEKAMTAPVEFVSVFDPTKRTTGPRLPGGESFSIPEPKPAESPAPKKKPPTPPRPEWSAVGLLARELTRPDNRQFARTTVNRIWYVMLGRGLVHPVDLDHSRNPPSHPELLDLLTNEFIAHGYDLRWLVREMLLSETWQRSGLLPGNPVATKPGSFAVALERPLMAEQLLSSVLVATGNTDVIQNARKVAAENSADASGNSATAAETETAAVDTPKAPTLAELKAGFAGAFANEAREPEGEFTATVKGALFWRNADLMQALLQRRPGNLMDRLMHFEKPSQIIDELYLSVLSRFPSDEERSVMTAYLEASDADRETALRDATWALLTSIEFYVNH
ncbi:MAG: DUF1553 domain-containing protein [Planctomycetota bacterium]|nr:DUF1553 domain-containing protein [Planctomycetota bacterium]MDA1164358.1 DUF1553 domain-containing protein [Planctomycetota bacterium]